MKTFGTVSFAGQIWYITFADNLFVRNVAGYFPSRRSASCQVLFTKYSISPQMKLCLFVTHGFSARRRNVTWSAKNHSSYCWTLFPKLDGLHVCKVDAAAQITAKNGGGCYALQHNQRRKLTDKLDAANRSGLRPTPSLTFLERPRRTSTRASKGTGSKVSHPPLLGSPEYTSTMYSLNSIMFC